MENLCLRELIITYSQKQADQKSIRNISNYEDEAAILYRTIFTDIRQYVNRANTCYDPDQSKSGVFQPGSYRQPGGSGGQFLSQAIIDWFSECTLNSGVYSTCPA